MTDDYNDLNMDNDNDEEERTPAPSQSNRTFLLAAGILGGLFLFGLILIALFVFLIRPNQRAANEAVQGTATALAITQTAESAAQTVIAKAPTVAINTPTATRQVAPTSTWTPVVAVPTEPAVDEQTEVAEANTATVAALLTEVAQAQLTTTPDAEGTGGEETPAAPTTAAAATATALPTTGFADEVGIPGLFGLALVLMVVIFVVRRLRTA